MKLDIAIEPIITDNTAFTVLTALQSLGYAELKHVERADHYIFDVDDAASAEDIVAKVARAEVVFNPNKHRLRFARENDRAAGPALGFEALVRDKDEENGRLLSTLAGTFAIARLHSLERAVSWHLLEANGEAGRDRLDWACRTLLANPISQRYWIRPVPAYEALAVATR